MADRTQALADLADHTLFPVRGARARPLVTVEVGRRSAWLRGTGITAALDAIESPRMWCPWRHCLTIPVDHVDDLLAVLEHRQRRTVILAAVDR